MSLPRLCQCEASVSVGDSLQLLISKRRSCQIFCLVKQAWLLERC
jgi:hypothetical protein